MHLEYFGLVKPPFAGEPDTDIFFPEADRTALLRRMYADLQNGSRVIRLTGAEGSGKTLLCLLLAHLLPAEFQAVYLPSPAGSFDELLRAACQELNQQPQADMVIWLHGQIEQHHAQGRQFLLLIDQAELMFPAALERLLRTVFAEEQKVLQVILAGRSALNDRIGQLQAYCADMKLPPSHQLAPLTEEELAAYLSFRLKAAGISAADSGRAFSGEAVCKIFELAKGNLRTAHLLADTALQRACTADRYFPVLAADVTYLESGPSSRPGKKKAALFGRAWKLLAAAALLLFTAVLFRYSDALRRSGGDAAKKMVSVTAPVKPEELLPDKIRLNSEPQLPPEKEEPAAGASVKAESVPPETKSVEPLQVAAQKKTEEQTPEEEPLETPPSSVSTSADPAVQAQQPSPERKIIELVPGMRKTKVKPKPALAAPPPADQLYQELLAAGNLLKKSGSGNNYSIQLLNLPPADGPAKLKELLVRDEYLELRSQLKLLRSSSALLVLYGSYASMNEAKAALDNMPLFLRKQHHPSAVPLAEALRRAEN